MRAAVTGGAGFIGSHLVQRLLADKHEVVVVDNFATGRLANLERADPERRAKLVELDISNTDALPASLEGVQWIFHLAALADIVPSIDHPSLYHRTNVDGTYAVLEAARSVGTVQKLVYAASSSSYGFPDIVPTPEDEPIRPTHPYALTKALAEQYVLAWSAIYGLPTISLRMFNVYGLGSRTSGAYGAVFGVFLKQKLAGHPFTVVGDGTQTRDFTYVTDVVDAFVKAAASPVAGDCFNVGSGHTYSVNRLVELLGGDVVHVPKRPGEPDCTFADASKIRRVLGWEPKISFEEGVATMAANIEMWRDAPLWTAENIADATRQWFKYLDRDADAPGHG